MQGDFRIGEWLVQPQLNQISGNRKTTRVEPKAMQVLMALASHPTEVVSKEKLIRTVWADTFVTDDVLTRCISELRKAFDDDARESRVIETIPKSGYRLRLEVHSLQSTVDGSHATQAPAPHWRSKAAVATLAVSVLLTAAGFLAWRAARPPASVSSAAPTRVMLAVLPLANLSAKPEEEYYSDGLTAELIARLGELPAEHFGVIAWSTTREFKNSKKTLPEIGGALGVSYLLEGTVRREGQRVGITAELIQVRDQTHLWAKTYDGDLRDVLTLQREVATDIAGAIRLRLADATAKQANRQKPINLEAYELYLQATFHYDRRTEIGHEQSIQFFKQSLEKDPSYAPAYAGLTSALLDKATGAAHVQRKDGVAQARAAAEKAVGLDTESAEAHAALGRVLMEELGQEARSEAEFRKAIELNPSYAYARYRYAMFLSFWGRFDEALPQMQRAHEFDPLTRIINANIGYILILRREYDQAIQHLHRVIQLDPDSAPAHGQLGNAYEAKGMIPEAIAEDEKSAVLYGDPAQMVRNRCEALQKAYATAGRNGYLRKRIEMARRQYDRGAVNAAFELAILFARLGEAREAVRYLEEAYQATDCAPATLKWEAFDGIRSDPHFQDLVRRMNFPPKN